MDFSYGDSSNPSASAHPPPPGACHDERAMRVLTRIVPALVALVLVAGCAGGGPAGLDLPAQQAKKATVVIDPLGRVRLSPADGSKGLAPLPERISIDALGTESFMEAVFQNVSEFWANQLEKLHRKPPTVTFQVAAHGEKIRSDCLPRTLPEGTEDLLAFFCPLDNHIVVSQRLAEQVREGRISSPAFGDRHTADSGDLAVAYVIAHEYGHAVQFRLGLFDRDSGPSPRIEQHADCWGGVWAHDAVTHHTLEDANLGEAVAAAGLVGDYEANSPGHHGTPASGWRPSCSATPVPSRRPASPCSVAAADRRPASPGVSSRGSVSKHVAGTRLPGPRQPASNRSPPCDAPRRANTSVSSRRSRSALGRRSSASAREIHQPASTSRAWRASSAANRSGLCQRGLSYSRPTSQCGQARSSRPRNRPPSSTTTCWVVGAGSPHSSRRRMRRASPGESGVTPASQGAERGAQPLHAGAAPSGRQIAGHRGDPCRRRDASAERRRQQVGQSGVVEGRGRLDDAAGRHARWHGPHLGPLPGRNIAAVDDGEGVAARAGGRHRDVRWVRGGVQPEERECAGPEGQASLRPEQARRQQPLRGRRRHAPDQVDAAPHRLPPTRSRPALDLGSAEPDGQRLSRGQQPELAFGSGGGTMVDGRLHARILFAG